MNKSSSVLSEEDRNVSSFFNESCESVAKCCQFRQKYEDCYREMSQARIECRNLKQENTVLRGSLRGTEEENAVLKNILASKKEIIGKLNRDTSASNQEISRLEDQLHLLTQQHQQQTAIMQEIQEESQKMKQELKVLTNRCEKSAQDNQRLSIQNRKLKQEQEDMRDEYSKQMQRIIQERDQTITQTHQLLFKKIEELGSNMYSPVKTSKNASLIRNKQNTPPAVTLKDLDTSLASFKHRHQQYEGKYQQIMRAKDAEIHQLTQQVHDLEGQMAESMELFEQQIAQSQQLKQALAQQQQHAQASQATKTRQSEREQLLISVGKRIAAMLKNVLIDSSDLVDRLLAALPLAKKFQLQVLLKQAETCCEDACRNTLRNAIGSKQFQQTNRALDELRQDYQLLQLKHATLQRQYGEILEDNQRLIKYNHLSRYRLVRNAQPLESTPYLSKRRDMEDYSNKENIGSTINH